MSLQKWVKLSSKRVFTSKFLSVDQNIWQLPSGEITENFFSFSRPDYVIMVAVDQDNNILVERTFRQAVNDFIFEMPAGFIEPGEDYEATAAREFAEETGYQVVSCEYQGKFFPLAGPTAMTGHLVFIRFDSTQTPVPDREIDETMECFLMSETRVKEMIQNNEIVCMGAVASLGRYFLKSNRPSLYSSQENES
jgi:ADP-ribose pyrophosphatase